MVEIFDPLSGQGSIALRNAGVSQIPSSTAEVLGSAAGGGFEHAFPSADIARIIDQTSAGQVPTVANNFAAPNADSGIAADVAERDREDTPAVMLSPEDANKRFGIPNVLSFDAPVYEHVAEEQYQRKRDDLFRQSAIDRREDGIATGALARGAAGLAGGLPGIVDPINLAASFLPVVGPARAALWASKYGLAGVAAKGAIEGAVGQAALTPLAAGIAKYDNEDFTAADALFNIALGGIFGGGLHTALHLFGRAEPGLSDQLEAAHPDTRDALLRGSIANLVDDKPVSVRPEIAAGVQPAEPHAFANVEAPVAMEPSTPTIVRGVEENAPTIADPFEGRTAAEHIAALETETQTILARHAPEDVAEVDRASGMADYENNARALEQAAACLGRSL